MLIEWDDAGAVGRTDRSGASAVRRFKDRVEAGRALAERLQGYARRSDVLVLGLPRGGVPVAFEVAQALHVPLDVFLVRKLGVPGHEELAMGAIASGGVRVLNESVVRSLGIAGDTIEWAAAREGEELARRERAYRDDRPSPDVAGRTVILIDDGLATGATMRAAAAALRQKGPARLVIAVPTAAPETCADIGAEVDEMVCLIIPEPFYAVGLWYEDFTPTTDEEVRALLERSHSADAGWGKGAASKQVTERAGEDADGGDDGEHSGARGSDSAYWGTGRL